jgi:hypothetical protein
MSNEAPVIELPAESFTRAEERGLPALVPPAGNAGSLLQAIERVASNPAMDIDKIERLFAMHQQLRAKEAEAAFNDAMARAQAQIAPVARNAYNEHTRSGYAKLDAIHRMILPIYPKEGLSISFDSGECPTQGWMRTLAFVSHSAGHTRQYHIDLPPDESGSQGKVNKTKVQAAGSTNEYARRYLTLMIFNVSTFDDKDGNGAKRKEEVEPDSEGKKLLEACASTAALQAAWKKLTVDQRKTLHGVVEDCQVRIEEADKAAAK